MNNQYMEPVYCRNCRHISLIPGGTIDYKKLLEKEKITKCCEKPFYFYDDLCHEVTA